MSKEEGGLFPYLHGPHGFFGEGRQLIVASHAAETKKTQHTVARDEY